MKKFKVNMQWDFALGHSIYNSYRQWLYRDRLAKDFDRTISINGESGAYVSVYSGLYNGGGPLSWFVEDGSYARLRNFGESPLFRLAVYEQASAGKIAGNMNPEFSDRF